MKNKFTFRLRQLLTMFAVLAISVSSCQKQETITPKTADERSNVDPLVKSAIEWYSKHSQNTKEESSKDLSLSDYRPDWSTVVISRNSKGVPIVNVKLVNQDEYYADSRFMELSVSVDQSGQTEGLVKEFLTNPYETDAKTNLYTGDGKFIISGEYNRSASQLQKLSAVASDPSCSTNPDGGTTGSSGTGGNPGPCNDDGSDPGGGGGGEWLDEVTVTDTKPGSPPTFDPEIPYPKIEPGKTLPIIPKTTTPTIPKSDLGALTFKFVKITAAYKQAGVKNLRIRVYDMQRKIYRTINLPVYVLGVRGTMTDSQAATFVTNAINDATDQVWILYRASSNLPDDPTVIFEFEKLVRGRLSFEGGTLQRFGPQTDPRVIVSEADYDLF